MFCIKGKKSYNFKKRGKKLAIYVNLGYFDLFTTKLLVQYTCYKLNNTYLHKI